MTIKPLSADVATIRAAILDVLDAGPMRPPYRGAWIFQQDESELENQHRMAFVDLIVARIAQLQQPPFVEHGTREEGT